MTFEAIERFLAVEAAPQRLARGRSETADLLRMQRSAAGTFGRRVSPKRSRSGAFGWRCDAIGAQLLASLVADPVGRPWRRKDRLDPHIGKAGFVESRADGCLDDQRRGAAGVGWRDDTTGGSQRTPRTMPRSVTDTAGISGSGTVARTAMIRSATASSRTSETMPITRPRQGRCAADTASLRADGRDARHDGRSGRQ